jgi:hypothetical protein
MSLRLTWDEKRVVAEALDYHYLGGDDLVATYGMAEEDLADEERETRATILSALRKVDRELEKAPR